MAVFRSARKAAPRAAAAVPDAALNPATRVTVADLIELQRYAAQLDLSHARAPGSILAGSHLSRFRGRGMDYQESRAYQAGDDVRNIDWRVTARTGMPHTKTYKEEREQPVVLFVDLNPGMFFGSRGALKSVVAARTAALIAWAAAGSGDRVGGMLFNENHHDLQPRGGRQGVLRLIRHLVDQTDPRAGVNARPRAGGLNIALGRLRRVSRPGSLITLIGDYYGIDEESRTHLLQLRQNSDVVAIQIVDALEEAPPAAGRYGVAGPGASGVLDTRSASARRAYTKYFTAHHQALVSAMRRCAIPLLRITTTDDVVAVLRRRFATRGVRPRRERLAA